MAKKYELTTATKEIKGHTVYRIKALKSFDTIIGRRVKKGDLGGWVESEANLSQEGLCWIFDEATGYENSRRSGNSVGYGNSVQSGDSVHITGCDDGTGCILCIGPCGDSHRTVTVQPDNTIVAGCFHGSFKEFKQAVVAKYGKDYGSYSMCIKILNTALKCRLAQKV